MTFIKQIFLLVIFFLGITQYAVAAEVTVKVQNPEPIAAREKASTNLNFDDLLIQGKYHFSDEAVVTVEQDKALDALLGVRKDFKDRLKQSASRD